MRALILAVVLIAGCTAKEQTAKPVSAAVAPQIEVKQEAKKPTQEDYNRMAAEAVQRIEDQREAERKAIAKAEEEQRAKAEEAERLSKAKQDEPASPPIMRRNIETPQRTAPARDQVRWFCRKCGSSGQVWPIDQRCPSCGSRDLTKGYR